MGGAICVAIRKGDDEHILDAWTNSFNWALCQPSFLVGGKAYKDYIGRAARDNEWPKSKIIDHIKLIEYGVVLIDLNHRQVLSYNDYTTPGTVMFADYDPESVALVRGLCRKHMLSHIVTRDRTEPAGGGCILVAKRPTDAEISKVLASREFGTAHLHPAELYVQHECERKPSKQSLDWMEHWLRYRGWTATLSSRRDGDWRMAGNPPYKLKITKRKSKGKTK